MQIGTDGTKTRGTDITAGADADDAFVALANYRRRYTLRYLLEGSEPVALDELATALAAAETDADRGSVADDERHTMLVSLHHAHLPKLREASLVEYDDASETVALTRRGRHVAREFVRLV